MTLHCLSWRAGTYAQHADARLGCQGLDCGIWRVSCHHNLVCCQGGMCAPAHRRCVRGPQASLSRACPWAGSRAPPAGTPTRRQARPQTGRAGRLRYDPVAARRARESRRRLGSVCRRASQGGLGRLRTAGAGPRRDASCAPSSRRHVDGARCVVWVRYKRALCALARLWGLGGCQLWRDMRFTRAVLLDFRGCRQGARVRLLLVFSHTSFGAGHGVDIVSGQGARLRAGSPVSVQVNRLPLGAFGRPCQAGAVHVGFS